MGGRDCENVEPLLVQEVCRLSDCESEKSDEKEHPQVKTEKSAGEVPVKEDSYREHFPECAVKNEPLEEDQFEEGECRYLDQDILNFCVKIEVDLPGDGVEKGPHECPDCAQVFPEIRQLREHACLHNRCSFCPRSFGSPEKLGLHLRTHASENPFKCSYCSKTFRLRRCLKVHLKTHTGKGVHKCDECSKSFPDVGKLKRHIKTHTRPHVCPTCSKRFGDHTNFRRHKESQHLREPRDDRPASCAICGRTFANSTSLKRHMHTHAEDLPFQCSQCPRAFANNKNLLRHTRVVHMEPGERPFQCSQCPKSFGCYHNFKRHHKVHKEEVPFECSECPKAFKRNTLLDRHLKWHSGSKPGKRKVPLENGSPAKEHGKKA
ncbi:zinc finger protein 317 [Drosophila biarmipes]|uniref:zinc finger protein 317 n=1 Tax=Drosophila biarmipes TaxID=125945 RepID=UPI0007E621F8|nr:zinc finger protein 317 [Drosophila biarmipes]